MLSKSCQSEPPSLISVQEQPSENFLSEDTQAKLVMIDHSCRNEPSSPISVQEQPSEVEYLK